MEPKFKVGDIVRYGDGPTALMKITQVREIGAGYCQYYRFYGDHVLRGLVGANSEDCRAPTLDDIKTWWKHNPKDDPMQPPVAAKLYGAESARLRKAAKSAALAAGFGGRVPLETALAKLLNSYGAESASGTPDYILAKYLLNCLSAYDEAVKARNNYWQALRERV